MVHITAIGDSLGGVKVKSFAQRQSRRSRMPQIRGCDREQLTGSGCRALAPNVVCAV